MSIERAKSPNGIWWIIALLWFSVWHLIITWQVWEDPLRRVPGPIGDNTVMLWNLGWVHHALSHGSPGFWFPNAYYPDGFLFLYGTHTWLDGLLYWLASPVLPNGIDGAILWANITMLIATVGTGLLCISALRAWGITRWSVLLLAASGVAFSWFRMFALLGHYHFFGTHWMMLALCLLSWARNRRSNNDIPAAKRLVMMSGLALGVTFLNDQTMGVFAGVLGGLMLLSRTYGSMKERLGQLVYSGSRYYGFALIPASVHLVPLVVAAVNGHLHYSVDPGLPRLVDASSLVIPPDFHVIGYHLKEWRSDTGLGWSEGTYLGVVPALLLLAGTIGSIRFLLSQRDEQAGTLRLCFYATCAAWGFLLCALGDRLMIGREQYITMPGRLLKELPLINNIRMPQRWVWPAHLCIALGGAAALMQWIDMSSRRWLVWLPLPFALIPPVEGKSHPTPDPVDYRHDTFLRPPGLIEAVEERYTHGGVLTMPVELAYAHANIFQFIWGYDIPLTVVYTARMPFTVHEVPWHGNVWTPETADWLKEKEVSIIVFSFHDGQVEEFQPWIRKAKASVPGLIVLNRSGQEI